MTKKVLQIFLSGSSFLVMTTIVSCVQVDLFDFVTNVCLCDVLVFDLAQYLIFANRLNVYEWLQCIGLCLIISTFSVVQSILLVWWLLLLLFFSLFFILYSMQCNIFSVLIGLVGTSACHYSIIDRRFLLQLDTVMK